MCLSRVFAAVMFCCNGLMGILSLALDAGLDDLLFFDLPSTAAFRPAFDWSLNVFLEPVLLVHLWAVLILRGVALSFS
jgi:hypothetical protein